MAEIYDWQKADAGVFSIYDWEATLHDSRSRLRGRALLQRFSSKMMYAGAAAFAIAGDVGLAKAETGIEPSSDKMLYYTMELAFAVGLTLLGRDYRHNAEKLEERAYELV